MDKDDLWIVEHFSELVTKYAGKYVAVVNETLVAVGESARAALGSRLTTHNPMATIQISRNTDRSPGPPMS